MALSWNEIKHRAVGFSAEFKEESREHAEAKSFWDAFFDVFGISRRRVASFEQAVALVNRRRGFIDLFWKGLLLVEHKSRGEDLSTAYTQALDYFPGIAEDDLPRFVLVSDFARFRLHDLESSLPAVEFRLEELHKYVHAFAFLLGREQRRHTDEAPANIKAAQLMGQLHDVLKGGGYTGHQLELLLVRVLFCLFADDTGIFEKDTFRFYLEEKTKPDGTDLGLHLNAIFDTLDTAVSNRQAALDEELQQYPYVNGTLFKERFSPPAFDSRSREMLLSCARYDWSQVSPAVFGSLFQVAMDPLQRHYLGAHYTAESNILRAIRPLFLDDLEAEAERVKMDKRQLEALLGRIAKIRILDPACGCGTFLLVAYRHLRSLELTVFGHLKRLSGGQESFSVDFAKSINVDSMYGIELEELPARIAETALWVVDHQMNVLASEQFGQYFTRLPLTTSPNIRHGNALTLNWADVVDPKALTYVVGNPPFAGKKRRTAQQNQEHASVCAGVKSSGVLDFVCCWFLKAAEFVRGTKIEVAFVATNSISQGEQVGILWGQLLKLGMSIAFAHRTFAWTNDAGRKAQVHVIIIGFGPTARPVRRLFDYVDPAGDPIEARVTRINPYLVDAETTLLSKRKQPICPWPPITFGSMPNDGGHLLLDASEKESLLAAEPAAEKWLRPILSSHEYLNRIDRWCLWLGGILPSELAELPEIKKRVEGVFAHRAQSTREGTRKLARFPTLFGEIRQPQAEFIVVPRHSSETRRYIPMAIEGPSSIVSDSCAWVGASDPFTFGVLMSGMHMAWVRQVCGRIKSDFRYSNELVYNNFPWPHSTTPEARSRVTDAARDLLAVRQKYIVEPLEALYDPVSMPADLVRAHGRVDTAVEKCYRRNAFKTDLERVAFLFEQYLLLTAPLAPVGGSRKRAARRRGG